MIRRARRAQEPSVGISPLESPDLPSGDEKQADGFKIVREAGAATGPGTGGAVPKLGELLLEKRYITGTQLSETLLQQSVSGKRLGTLLVELGIVDEANLAAALAEQLSLPLIDLSDQVPEPDALKMLPETVARSLGALPLRNTAAGLEIAVADPGPRTKEELSRAAGSPVLLLVASPSDVKPAIDSLCR